MPVLKSFLLFCCFYPAIFINQNHWKGANIGFDDQNTPAVVSTVDSYKNTTLTDTNQAMIRLGRFLSTFYTDFKYATSTNFTGRVLYNNPAAYLRLPAARAMQQALNELSKKGLTLKIYDAYRPYSVTKIMWQVVPDTRYAADPSTGSSHNRGTAVDVTLADIDTGEEVEMPTDFDDFTVKAHHNYKGSSRAATKNRFLLQQVMENAGFASLDTEWWHYTFKSPTHFALLDLSFEQLEQLTTP